MERPHHSTRSSNSLHDRMEPLSKQSSEIENDWSIKDNGYASFTKCLVMPDFTRHLAYSSSVKQNERSWKSERVSSGYTAKKRTEGAIWRFIENEKEREREEDVRVWGKNENERSWSMFQNGMKWRARIWARCDLVFQRKKSKPMNANSFWSTYSSTWAPANEKFTSWGFRKKSKRKKSKKGFRNGRKIGKMEDILWFHSRKKRKKGSEYLCVWEGVKWRNLAVLSRSDAGKLLLRKMRHKSGNYIASKSFRTAQRSMKTLELAPNLTSKISNKSSDSESVRFNPQGREEDGRKGSGRLNNSGWQRRTLNGLFLSRGDEHTGD